jgi:DNA-binding GntR family transcriptional regulator
VSRDSDETGSRAERVYDSLRSDIKDGRYAGGTRLRERDIAQELGVSRTPVREALQRLVHIGLLTSAPGGLVVKELSRSQILDLYAAREVLEGAVAAFAARHATPSEISNLHYLADVFAKSGGNLRGIWTANRDLHSAIYAASHNDNLMRIVQDLNDPLALIAGTTYSVPGRFEAAVAEHNGLIEAIEKRDDKLADELAKAHVRKSFEARLRMMSGDPTHRR